ncbi:hypothetical protein HMPREF1544_01052 [Mucor circinelloides 1006PhL]|uniref:Plasma membrane fusion protein PRM1 n=1 Tax=Mucor circinelloides f. circinelloides (strain 1006PhL) TaxID=1220926 RepID=S2KHV3_MUCC1|nr:hypothetical protein HMPREF1544_01052 [Mucor circinelloides 1006PhL]
MLRTLNEKYALAWLQISTITLFTLIGSLIYLLNYISIHLDASRSRLETVCDSINISSEQIFNAPSILLQASINSVYTAKNNIHRNLSTAVNVIENIIVWLISMYKSTYRCLLGLAVRSILSLVTQIAGPIQKVAQGVTSFLHLDESTSQIMGWTESLNNTQHKIEEWFNNDDAMIRSWIDKPFSALQSQLNSTFDAWQPPLMTNITTNTTTITTTTANFQRQPCQSDQLLSAINQVEHELTYFIYIVIGVLVGLVVVCTVVNLIAIRFRHHQVAQARALFLNLYQTENTAVQQDLVDRYIWTTSTIMLSWQKRKQRLHQLFHFMSHPIVVYCLVVGVAGVCMTYGLAWLMESKSQQAYAAFAMKTQAWTANATAEWTNSASHQFTSINGWLNETELDLNNHAFGIIKSSAITINDTLSTVVDQIHTLIQTVLGGTPLETPAKELTQCLLLTKIENIEQGLTWIAGHSYVHLTRIDVPQFDVMLMGPTMQESIQQHINMNDSSFITEQLNGFQIKYYFFADRQHVLV